MEPISAFIRTRNVRDHHITFHGSVPGSGALDLPTIAPRRHLDPNSRACISKEEEDRIWAVSGKERPGPPPTEEQVEAGMKDCHYCQIKNFKTSRRYPITIFNEVDDSELPSDFSFIEKSILCDGVDAASDEFKTGCECETDYRCERRDCHCLQDMKLIDKSPGNHTKINAYISKGYKADCLRNELLETRDAIYECHEKCACSIKCNNRVVERGRRIPLEIFRTSDGRGWGVRSCVDIQEGQYVDKYVGEIITAKEANRRREASGISQRKDVYLFALDKFSDSSSMDPRLAGPPYEVDGEFKSGPTRFINHSCDPNLRSFARVGDHADKHIHDLALFACRYIPAGEELTFDYVDGEDADAAPVWEADIKDLEHEMTRCLCRSKNCRGFLW